VIVGGSVPTVNADLDLALECARRAADIVRKGFATDVPAEFKGSVDPVTEIDRAAEDAIRRLLADARPADSILGEEGGGDGWRIGRVWIVDPLDGTVNFIHRLPQVSVSVALWEDGQPVVGVVQDAIRDEVFAAAAGEGATVDGRPLEVSSVNEIGGALVATGFPYDRRERASELVEVLGRVLSRVQGIRRIGSAALDLCYVAAGRFDAYWEYRLQPWDTAAGQLIVTEAGGTVTDLTGAEYRPDSPGLLASNGAVHDELRSVIEP
jgi:myo-inositol-1(or 4)-monophosphatase